MNELTRTPETVGAEIRGLTAQAKQMTLWFGIADGVATFTKATA